MLINSSVCENSELPTCRLENGSKYSGCSVLPQECQRPSSVSKTMWLDQPITMDTPDAKGRGEILSESCGNTKTFGRKSTSNGTDNNIDFTTLGSLTEGYMPQDLNLLVKRSASSIIGFHHKQCAPKPNLCLDKTILKKQ